MSGYENPKGTVPCETIGNGAGKNPELNPVVGCPVKAKAQAKVEY